jgi:phage terminase Nu1 subunit (DNA packaging protein)
MQHIVNTKQLAESFGVSVRRINDMVELGMPKLDRGKNDLSECWRWRYSRLEERQDEKAEKLSITEQRARLTKAKADSEELKLKLQREELVTKEVVLQGLDIIIGRSRSRLLALPSTAAPRVFGVRDLAEIQEILRKLVYQALDELSKAWV